MRRVAIRTTMLSAIVSVGLMSCEDDERYVIRTEEYLIGPAGAEFLGAGCSTIRRGTSISTGGGQAGAERNVRFGATIEALDRGARVTVVGITTLERQYDESWLRGEKPADVLEVPVDDARTYRLELKGGQACSELPVVGDLRAGGDAAAPVADSPDAATD